MAQPVDPSNPNHHSYWPWPLHAIAEEASSPMDKRLAWAEEAISPPNARDPNELHTSVNWRDNMGRPLHMALGTANSDDQLGLIQWFLDHDADPRLADCRGLETPIDRAWSLARVERLAAAGEDPATKKGAETRRRLQWFTKAAEMMEGKARELDDRDRANEKRKDKNGEKKDRKREVDCLWCRKGQGHAWHYMCYAETEEEARSLEPADYTVYKDEETERRGRELRERMAEMKAQDAKERADIRAVANPGWQCVTI